MGISFLGSSLTPSSVVIAADPAYPVAAPAQGFGTGLTALYFSNGTLAGAPVVKRLDASIDFHWGKEAPAPELPADNFSVRWEGLLAAPSTGSYKFVVPTSDGVRLWVNGRKVLDTWNGKNTVTDGATVSLAAGEKTAIKLEYFNEEGDARVQLQWIPPGQAAQTIPMGNLYPVGSPTTPDPAGPRPVVAAATPKPAPAAKPAAPVAKAATKPATPAKPASAPAKPAAPVAKAATTPATPAKPAAPAKAVAAAKPAATPAVVATPIVSGNVYTLTARANGKALEVLDESRPYRSMQAKSGRASAPQWKIESAGEGLYRLQVQGTSKVLEVLGSSTSNGATLDLWPYYSGNNQVWQIEDAGDGYYKLVAKHSRKALTAKDSVEGGLQQWRYQGKETQQWKIEPAVVEVASNAAQASAVPGIGAHKMSVYPNPSNGVVQMNYQLGEAMPLGWVLYDQRGIVVRVSDYRRQTSGAHNQTLDFTGLPAGDYNLHLTVGTTTTNQPVLIRRPKAEAVTSQEGAQ